MRRIFALFVLFALICTNACADCEIDIKKLTDDEIYSLIDHLHEELDARNQSNVKNSIDSVGYYQAEYIMSNYLKIENKSSSNKHFKINDDYSVIISNGIRLVTYNANRIMKVSARLDPEDGEASVMRMYLIASIFEEKLFEKDHFPTSEKRNAFKTAQNIVDTAMNLFGDNLIKVISSGKEGFSLLASTGNYIYYWEYIDGSVWFSVVFAALPDGMM